MSNQKHCNKTSEVELILSYDLLYSCCLWDVVLHVVWDYQMLGTHGHSTGRWTSLHLLL